MGWFKKKKSIDITKADLRRNIARLWEKGFRNLEIVVPSIKEIDYIKQELFINQNRHWMTSVYTEDIAMDGCPIIIDNTISRWFVRKRKEVKGMTEYGKKNGAGKGKGVQGGGRRNQNTKPCPSDGPGNGQGAGRGKGRNR